MKIFQPMKLYLGAVLVLSVATSCGIVNAAILEGGSSQARELWELAITAKGGHERLRAVGNLVVSSRGERHVDFYLFPNKVWMWNDDRPSPIGLSVEMYNLEENLAYLTYPNDPESPRRLGPSGVGSISLRDAQLYFLLETQWVKPVLIATRADYVGRRKADVVQTQVDGNRVDFYFERKTHLLLRVSFPAADPRGNYYVDFSDYTSIDGIQLPRNVSYMGSGWIPTNYQLNVTYDGSIFQRPPSIARGPGAWRLGTN